MNIEINKVTHIHTKMSVLMIFECAVWISEAVKNIFLLFAIFLLAQSAVYPYGTVLLLVLTAWHHVNLAIISNFTWTAFGEAHFFSTEDWHRRSKYTRELKFFIFNGDQFWNKTAVFCSLNKQQDFLTLNDEQDCSKQYVQFPEILIWNSSPEENHEGKVRRTESSTKCGQESRSIRISKQSNKKVF